ncbi:hypothetical protein MUP77_18825, partial [Candidatus Bathyarchaeota archaeon]|nr:hypothetical protein [Candidatus Bathyarchaeota archaeon]
LRLSASASSSCCCNLQLLVDVDARAKEVLQSLEKLLDTYKKHGLTTKMPKKRSTRFSQTGR